MTQKLFYPSNSNYYPVPGTIYAETASACPNPCRKYHVSTNVDSALAIATVILPILRRHGIHHKVVKSEQDYLKQLKGNQGGKFITIYMKAEVPQRNPVIREMALVLAELSAREEIRPADEIPKSRRYHHVFIEQPLDEKMFIWGGFVCDPNE